MNIPDKALQAAEDIAVALAQDKMSASFIAYKTVEAAAPFIAAQALRDAAHDWASNPEPWGDNEKDYRNELLDRADELEAGK